MSTVPRHRLLLEWWAGLVLLLALTLAIGWQARNGDQVGSDRLETAIYDVLSRLTGRASFESLLIVDIDDDSLGQIGQWPWSRAVHAEMVRRLGEAGARAIGLDLLLIDPSREDKLLGDALVRARERGTPVIIPVATSHGAAGTAPLYPEPTIGLNARLGHPHFRLDGDGNVRGLWLEEGGFPALSLLLAEAWAGDTALPSVARAALGHATPQARERTIETGQWVHGSFTLLPSLNTPIERVSYGAVLRGEVPPAALNGRIVLVGATAAGLGDRYPTALLPGDRLRPGVELHAAAVSALIQHQLIRPVAPVAQAVLGALPVMLLMFALYRLSPYRGLLATVLTALAVLVLAGAMRYAGHWWSPTGSLIAIALAYPLWSWRRLEVATAGLARQARALDRDAPLMPSVAASALPTEPIARSLERLGIAASRAVHLRQFLLESLERLPCPALIMSEDGHLLFANRRLTLDMHREPAVGTPMPAWLDEQVGLDISSLPIEDAKADHIELSDREGRDWLVDGANFQDPEWGPVRLLQFVDITPIRSAQREREQTLRFLSHDLRSPQVTILAIADLQARQLGGAVPTWLDDIRKEANRSLELANGFVELARAEGAVIAFDTIDLSNVIEEARDACWRAAQNNDARIVCVGVDEPAWAWGDGQLIRRALINLTDNAIKYGPQGGTVTIALRRIDDNWQITVTDEGSGLSEGDLEHLFQPYWRGKRQDKPGIGLGLSFVRVVAERHHGRVSASTVPSGGACMELWLPVHPAPPTDTDQRAEPHPVAD